MLLRASARGTVRRLSEGQVGRWLQMVLVTSLVVAVVTAGSGGSSGGSGSRGSGGGDTQYRHCKH